MDFEFGDWWLEDKDFTFWIGDYSYPFLQAKSSTKKGLWENGLATHAFFHYLELICCCYIWPAETGCPVCHCVCAFPYVLQWSSHSLWSFIAVVFVGGEVSGGQCLELQLGCLQNMQRAPALSSSSKSSFPTWALRILTDICIRVLTFLSSSKIMISNLGIWQSQPTFVKQGSNFVEQLKIIISIPVIADLNWLVIKQPQLYLISPFRNNFFPVNSCIVSD